MEEEEVRWMMRQRARVCGGVLEGGREESSMLYFLRPAVTGDGEVKVCE